MDYAVFVGEEKTLLYKKGQGIVLNEPSVTAHKDGKIIAVGKSALQFNNASHFDVTIQPLVKHGRIKSVETAAVFFAHMFKKMGRVGSCLICIPSSLDAHGLNGYKNVIYSSYARDVVITFMPQVIASAYASAYRISDDEIVLSIVTEGDSADLAIIRFGEIIDGGTLPNLEKFEEAKSRLVRAYPDARVIQGDRLSVINGAGRLLENDSLIRRIVELN